MSTTNSNGPDTPSNSNEDVLWDNLLTSLKQEQGAAENLAGNNNLAAVGDLKRWSFFSTIAQPQQALTLFTELRDEHISQLAAIEQKWVAIYNAVKQRFTDKITLAQEDIKNLEIPLAKDNSELAELIEKKKLVTSELIEIRKRLAEIRLRLADAKKDMLTHWLEEAEKQIDKALQIQGKVYAEIKKINQQTFDNNRTALLAETEFFKTKRKNYEERYANVHARINILASDGITPTLAKWFIAIGTVAAAAAGYFFSAFTYATGFSNQDIFYYILNGFMEAGHDNAKPLWLKLLFLILFITIITVVSWLCYRAINKFFPKENSKKNSNYQFSANFKYDGLKYSEDIKSINWFSFWLRAIPGFIIAGIVILILSANKDGVTGINFLNASTEGLVIGTALSTSLAALMHLYLMKVIEPRLLKHLRNELTLTKWLKLNWEVCVAIVLFITSVIFTLIFSYTSNIQEAGITRQSSIVISLSQFIPVCLLAAFPLAYGRRFKGLLDVSRFLERQIAYFEYRIAYNPVPEAPQIEFDYTKRVQGLIDATIGTLENKILLLQGRFEGKKPTPPPSDDIKKTMAGHAKTIFKKAADWFMRKSKFLNPPQGVFTPLTEWEAIYFPEFDELVKITTEEYRTKEEELKETEKQITQIYNEIDNKRLLAENKKDKLLTAIDNWKYSNVNALLIEVSKTQQLKNIKTDDITKIADGFVLAMWYLGHGRGPRPDADENNIVVTVNP